MSKLDSLFGFVEIL